jgi:ABC-2 type transport system permease protein
MAVVISVVFSSIMRIQIEHFTVFYLSGSLIFSLMSEATNGSLGSILGAAGLIKKVYIPKYIFPFEKCLFALVNSMFSFIALVILMPILGVPLRPLNFLFFVPMIYVLIFSTGLGMILSAINVFFRDMGHLYGIFVAAWMYLTPIIYPEEIIPPALKGVMNFNPMYYYVTYFRQIMMYDIVPTMRLNLICIAFSVGFLLLGLFVFKKKQDRFILFI